MHLAFVKKIRFTIILSWISNKQIEKKEKKTFFFF
jgi:hypothetical protein